METVTGGDRFGLGIGIGSVWFERHLFVQYEFFNDHDNSGSDHHGRTNIHHTAGSNNCASNDHCAVTLWGSAKSVWVQFVR